MGAPVTSARHRALLAISYVLSLACLLWTLRDAHLSQFRSDLKDMHPAWFALAVVADIGVYAWQAMRWRILLLPIEVVPYRRSLRAIYTGLFANEVLPFKVGEVLRCYILSARSSLSFGTFLSSAVIERIFDGIWLSCLLWFLLEGVPREGSFKYLADGVWVLGVTVVVGVALLVVFAFNRDPSHQLTRSLRTMGRSRHFYLAFVQSLPYLLLQIVPVWAAARGYGFNHWMPTIGAAATTMVILRLGSVLPQAPGNLGVYQFLAKETLQRVYHVAPDEASRFALLLWGIVTLPLLAGGAAALAITGSHLDDLTRAAEKAQASYADPSANQPGAKGS